MKIVLVLLNGFLAKERGKIFNQLGRKGAYAPATLTTLASLVPDVLNARIELIDEFVNRFDPEKVQADLVGLSFTTPNANHAYRIARILRQRGITVVMGGYHTTAMPEEALENADACVLGYAEGSWPLLLQDFNSGNLKPVYRDPFINGFRNLHINSDYLPDKRKYFYSGTLEYSRSCNNTCRFCVIPAFNNRPVYYRSPLDVARDVRMIGGDEVVFLDSSPTEDIDHFLLLCSALKDLKVKWYSCITFKLADRPDIISQMADSGCKGVLVGFESLIRTSLKGERKGFNHPENYAEFIRMLHDYGIYVFGSFVFGFDHDDRSVFDATIDFVDGSAIDLVHYAILTPFPGSQLFEDLKNEDRIITYDWSLYDSLHATFMPRHMSPEELQNGFRKAYTTTHSLKSIIKRSAKSPCRSKKIFLGNMALGYYGRKVMNA